MTRFFLIITAAFALLAGQSTVLAGNPARQEGSARLSFDVEWGYDATLINIYHYNYMETTDGFRIDEKAARPMYYSNGHASAGITLEFARRWALGLHAGYAGIQQRTRCFPLSLRATYFMDSFFEDGAFAFIEGGAGIQEARRNFPAFGRIGYGYRTILDKNCSLDISGSLRAVYDHPMIYDVSIPGYIPQENIRRSDALYGTACISIAINF